MRLAPISANWPPTPQKPGRLNPTYGRERRHPRTRRCAALSKGDAFLAQGQPGKAIEQYDIACRIQPLAAASVRCSRGHFWAVPAPPPRAGRLGPRRRRSRATSTRRSVENDRTIGWHSRSSSARCRRGGPIRFARQLSEAVDRLQTTHGPIRFARRLGTPRDRHPRKSCDSTTFDETPFSPQARLDLAASILIVAPLDLETLLVKAEAQLQLASTRTAVRP